MKDLIDKWIIIIDVMIYRVIMSNNLQQHGVTATADVMTAAFLHANSVSDYIKS